MVKRLRKINQKIRKYLRRRLDYCGSILLFLLAATIFLSCDGPLAARELTYSLPKKQIHPLPASLLQWQGGQNAADYFDRIKPTPLGYLIWSEFPIKIYFARPQANNRDINASQKRFEQWVKAVDRAIKEWNEVLPLQVVASSELADITIDRVAPHRIGKIDPETGMFDLPKARSAVTSYEFYLSQDRPPILSHRIKIEINPALGYDSILGAARHELGHGLGIWGHSLATSDIMYYSQTPNLNSISDRDINTLKKIYQQPTQLGWNLSQSKINRNDL